MSGNVAGLLMAMFLPGFVLAAESGLPATDTAASRTMTAEQVIDRYVAACGGAEKWHAIQTMAWNGHIETGPGGISKIPFMMLFRRPDTTRFELLREGQHLVRIFDGKQGWKVRPASTGLPEIKDYSDEEISYAHDAAGLDGPLFDHRAKGVTVVLAGLDTVDGHRAYRLELTLPSGRKRTDWIDAQNFQELKYDREVHNSQGRSGTVSVYYRDYRTVEGLTVPFVIETGGGAGGESDRMVIDKIVVNPPLEERLFARPAAPGSRHQGVVVDTTKIP